MGVTIHFQGRLKSDGDYQDVIAKAKALAVQVGSEVVILDSPNKTLLRVRDEKVLDYHGPVRGILFNLHPQAEPIVLEFDEDSYVQNFCKTQFAGIDTHLKVISFLRSIEPHFENLIVYDEGEFWKTGDIEQLETIFGRVSKAIEQLNKRMQN